MLAPVVVRHALSLVRALRRRSAEQEGVHLRHVAPGLVLVGVVRRPVQVEAPSPIFQVFLKWRDPESNRGHHDFQSYAEAFRYTVNPYR